MNKKYSICYNSSILNVKSVIAKLTTELSKYDVNCDIYDVNNIHTGADFAFVIGGDGTILKAARFYSRYKTPVFGINLGHLGFLSQATEQNIEMAVKKIINQDYIVESRIMLQAGSYIALNDFVIKGEEISRASSFSLEINSNFVCDYFADGIIISTPTGSTAYAMAAGGPILAPDLDAIVIAPICPHTLNARPIVVNSDSHIKLKSHPSQKYIVTVDGQSAFEFVDEIIISKSKFDAKLALLSNSNFYSVLTNKLHWGINPTKK